ncbi:hypothetical protein [Microbacterium sp. CBA3102]|uniref:hypothetical protein n=1 Tax=Microbacterium sp. CBA3102 TaxID=2603598 RepID=UPI00129416F9|nr:hypothetical protein [Microbacterium sp. CBA3102]
MSDIKDVHNAVRTDLQRRRELAAMTKPQLIDYIINVENNLAALAARIDAWAD